MGEYARPRPEQTLLYQLLEAHYLAFVEHLTTRARALPAHVLREFRRLSAVRPLGARLLASSLRGATRDVQLQATWNTSGILPCAPRASHRLRKIAPGDFVCPRCGACRLAEGAVLLVDEGVPGEPSEHGRRAVGTEFEVVAKARLRYARDVDR